MLLDLTPAGMGQTRPGERVDRMTVRRAIARACALPLSMSRFPAASRQWKRCPASGRADGFGQQARQVSQPSAALPGKRNAHNSTSTSFAAVDDACSAGTTTGARPYCRIWPSLSPRICRPCTPAGLGNLRGKKLLSSAAWTLSRKSCTIRTGPGWASPEHA
jgi:hypothetical protein